MLSTRVADMGTLGIAALVIGVVVILVDAALRRRVIPRRAKRSRRNEANESHVATGPPPQTVVVPAGVAVPLSLPPPLSAAVASEPTEVPEPRSSPEVPVRIQSSLDRVVDNPDSGALTRAADDAWVLNPRSPLPLTLIQSDEGTAKEVKALLETVYGPGMHEVVEGLVAILARSNARCREIDEYVREFKPHYLKAIESRIAASEEWGTASELDREDLLVQFKAEAIDTLDVRPYVGAEDLFDDEPTDFAIDDRILDRYGYESVRLYLQYRGRSKKVLRIPADHYHRKGFERLVQIGLAKRGSDITTVALLDGVTIKEMRELAADLAPPTISRRAKAIEWFAALPDARDRLGKIVAFREVFELLPLPSEFTDLDLDRVAETWRYTRAVADLMAHTYLMGAYSTRNADGLAVNDDIVGGWEVMDAGESSCPLCRRAAAKNYEKGRPPRVPLHIGCRCCVSPVTKSWDDLIADAGREKPCGEGPARTAAHDALLGGSGPSEPL